MYICPRMLGGAVKVSLHESGSWHVGLTKQNSEDFPSGTSRHWEIWNGGSELAAGRRYRAGFRSMGGRT